jgi:transcriptional regulator with XRE-family HTH domain
MTATTATPPKPPLGALLKEWRARRRLSQLDLALEAGVSARHLSFVETGRSKPSREMVLHLAEQLEVPLRDRNQLLLAAGYAPAYQQHAIDAPEMAPVRSALKRVLDGHDPYPAIVIDRWWNLVDANASLGVLLEGVSTELLEPPVNALRLALHPDGAAPRIANLGEWRAHLLARVERELAITGDDRLRALYDEVAAYPGPDAGGRADLIDPGAEIALPLSIRAGGEELHFFSTIATFGTAVDVTVAELSIEAFFPADERTANALRRRSAPVV